MQLDRLLSELRQLPADAPEWEEFDGFVLRLRQVAKDKETERELRRQALRDALSQLLAERSAELAYSGKTDCSTWSADTCPYVLIAAITDQVHEFADTLRIHGEVRRRSAATFEEDQTRIRQLEDLQREIHSRHSVISEVLSGKAPTSGPGGGVPPRRSEPTSDRSSPAPSASSGTKSRESVVVEEIVSGPSRGPAVSREADHAASFETAGFRGGAAVPSQPTLEDISVPPTFPAEPEREIELDLSGWRTPAADVASPQARFISAHTRKPEPIPLAAEPRFEIVIEEDQLNDLDAAENRDLLAEDDQVPAGSVHEVDEDEGEYEDGEDAPDIELDFSITAVPASAPRPLARISPPPFRPVVEPAPTGVAPGASEAPATIPTIGAAEPAADSPAASLTGSTAGPRPIKVERRWVPPVESPTPSSETDLSGGESSTHFVGILAGQPSVAPGAAPARSGEPFARLIGATPDSSAASPVARAFGEASPPAASPVARAFGEASPPAASHARAADSLLAVEGGAVEGDPAEPPAPIIELVEPLRGLRTRVGGTAPPPSAEDVPPGLSVAELRAVSDELGEDVVLGPVELRSPKATPESIVYDDSSNRHSVAVHPVESASPASALSREWGSPQPADVSGELLHPTPIGMSGRDAEPAVGMIAESPAAAAVTPWAPEPVIVIEEFGTDEGASPLGPEVGVLIEPELEEESSVPVPIRLARQHLNRQAARRLKQSDRHASPAAIPAAAGSRSASDVGSPAPGAEASVISNEVQRRGVARTAPEAPEAPVSASPLLENWAAERAVDQDDSPLATVGANGRGHYPSPTEHTRPQVASFDAARAGHRPVRSRERGRITPSRRGVLAVAAAVVIGALGVAGALAWNQGSAPSRDLPDGSRLALEYVSTGTYHEFQLSNPLQQAVLSRLPGMLKAEPAVQTQSDAKVFWVHRTNRTDGADPSLYDHQIWPGRVVPSDSHGCVFDNLLYTGKKAVPGAAPAWPRRDAAFPVALVTDQGEKVEFKVPGGGGRVDREWTPDAPGIVKPLGGLKLSLLSVDVGLKLQQIRGDALPVSNFIWRDFESVEASRASYPWIPSRESRPWNRAYLKIVGDRKAFDAWNLEGLNLSDATGNELSFRMGSEALQSRLGADGKLWVAWPGGLCRQERAWKLRLRFDPAGGAVRPDVSISANAVSIPSAGTARDLATRSSGAGISLNELKIHADGSEFRDLIPGAGPDPVITVVTRLEESHGVHLEFRVRDAQGQLLPGQLYRIGGSLKAPKFAYVLQGAGSTNNLTVSCAAWRTRPVDWYVSPKN